MKIYTISSKFSYKQYSISLSEEFRHLIQSTSNANQAIGLTMDEAIVSLQSISMFSSMHISEEIYNEMS